MPAVAKNRRRDWREISENLASEIKVERLHPAVLAWASGRSRAARAGWGVALSGGADSVALLCLLWAHWPKRRQGLVAFHFDHQLRGRASKADARFCVSLCKQLGVTLVEGKWARVDKAKAPSEAQARAARLAFIRKEMDARGLLALWLGHQRDDIAETLLMRLARGSGTGGLAAPRPLHFHAQGNVHVRPLLTLSKGELASCLNAAGGVWREDETNQGNQYLRNRIRTTVLPAWQQASPERDIFSGVALSRDLLEEDDAALDRWVDALKPLQGRVLNLTVLAGKPRAVFRRALQRWRLRLGEAAGDLSRQAFDILLAAVEAGKPTRFSIGRNGFGIIEDSRLKFKLTLSDTAKRDSSPHGNL